MGIDHVVPDGYNLRTRGWLRHQRSPFDAVTLHMPRLCSQPVSRHCLSLDSLGTILATPALADGKMMALTSTTRSLHWCNQALATAYGQATNDSLLGGDRVLLGVHQLKLSIFDGQERQVRRRSDFNASETFNPIDYLRRVSGRALQYLVKTHAQV
jgi:hypothetical protein